MVISALALCILENISGSFILIQVLSYTATKELGICSFSQGMQLAICFTSLPSCHVFQTGNTGLLILHLLETLTATKQAVPSGKTQNVCTGGMTGVVGKVQLKSAAGLQHQPELLYVCTHIQQLLGSHYR